jgi:acyl-coenzyme A thioesterase PaaI-like protein
MYSPPFFKTLRNRPSVKVFEFKLLEFYPPFLFMGAKIAKIAPNFRSVRVELPLRWYAKNHNGTMFGGFICSISDPIAALLCSRIFAECEVWTQSHSVQFLKPGRTRLHFDITLSDHDLERIREGLAAQQKVSHTFEFEFKDRDEKTVARVINTVYLRIKGSKKPE